MAAAAPHYPTLAYRYTRPDRTALVGRLLGLQPPAPAGARVLELGCGTGANLLPMAEVFPGARFVGVDVSGSQIAWGRELAAAAGIGNVDLRALDLVDVDAGFGDFDYIIAHGVYSWVPPAVRTRLLEVCAERLAPDGIALVSHSVTPGFWPKALVGEMLRWQVRAVADPLERVAAARAYLDRLVRETPDEPYRALLAEQRHRFARLGDAALLGDDLNEVCDGGPVLDFLAALEAHGLSFLADADVQSSIPLGFAPEAIEALGAVAGSADELEQALDYLKNRKFRVTLAGRAGVALDLRLSAAKLAGLHVASGAEPAGRVDPRSSAPVVFAHQGSSITVEQPLLKAALAALRARWPQPLPFAELARSLGADPGALAAGILGAFAARVVELAHDPPGFASRAGPRPRATALARVTAARGLPVASLRHAQVALEPADRAVLALLDGTRDRAALAAATGADVEPVLARLAGLALLAA